MKIKKSLALCMVVALLMGVTTFVSVFNHDKLEWKADVPMTATPTTTNIAVMHGNDPAVPDLPVGPYTSYRMLNDIPAYLIQQYNGFSSNYVKLRDIAYALDFCVKWDSAKPNEMRIYTNKHYFHYADQQPYTAEGPATEVRTATNSTMDLYVDDVLVKDVQPVMIGFNNYFKIRDLAKAVNFGCSFIREGYALPTLSGFPNTKLQSSIVGISYEFPYQDNDPEFMDADDYTKLANRYSIKSSPAKQKALKEHQANSIYYPAGSRRNIEYELTEGETNINKPVEDKLIRPTYGYPSGELLDTPVTITEDMPWARENYFDKYASKELKALLGYDASSDSKEQIMLERQKVAEFNAAVQMLIDQNKLGAKGLRRSHSSGTEKGWSLSSGNNFLREAYSGYRYPQAEWIGYGNNTLFWVYPTGLGDYTVETLAMVSGTWAAGGGQVDAKLAALNSDRERVQYLAELVCRKLEYAGAGEDYLVLKKRLNNVGVDVYEQDENGNGFLAYHEFCSELEEKGLDILLDESKQMLEACGGYADAFNVVARSAGFYSFGLAGEGHAWNEVWLPDEGKWVGVDCTWADAYYPVLDFNGNKVSRESKSFVGEELRPIISAIYDENWDIISTEKKLVCYDLGSDSDPHTRYLKEEAASDKTTKFTEEILQVAYKLNPQTYIIDVSESGNVELVSR